MTDLYTPLRPAPASTNGDLTFAPPLPTVFPVLSILLPTPVTSSLTSLANDLLKPPKAVPKTIWLVANMIGALYNVV